MTVDGRRRAGGGQGRPDGQSGEPDPEPDAGPEADPENVARAICLQLLTDRPRTRYELQIKLAARRVPEQSAATVLDRLTAVGLIDDAAYAQAWVSTRQRGRGLARRALREELRRRGVDRDVAEHALGQVGDDDELASARETVARRLPGLARLPAHAQRRRLVGLLGRRGYPTGVAERVIREAMDDARRCGGQPDARDADAGQAELPDAVTSGDA